MSGSALDKVREETVALRQVCFFIASLEFATKCAYQNSDSCFVFDQHVWVFQALALVSNSIQRDGCAVENLKMDVSQVN